MINAVLALLFPRSDAFLSALCHNKSFEFKAFNQPTNSRFITFFSENSLTKLSDVAVFDFVPPLIRMQLCGKYWVFTSFLFNFVSPCKSAK